jgi:hypothetical protein
MSLVRLITNLGSVEGTISGKLVRYWSRLLKYGNPRIDWEMWWGAQINRRGVFPAAVDHDDAASDDCKIAGPVKPIKEAHEV